MKPVGDNLVIIAKSAMVDDATFRRLFVWAVDECNPPPPEGIDPLVLKLVEEDQSALLRRIAEREEEKRQQAAERARRFRERHNANNANNANNAHHPSILPSTLPSIHPNTNRSVPVRAHARARGGSNGTVNGNGTVDSALPKTERNGNGTGGEVVVPGGIAEARRLAANFAQACRQDQGAFFAPEFDAVTVIHAVTGDYRSTKRWRQLVNAKGDAAVRDETFAFWRECKSGDEPKSRAAALNARLAQLPDGGNTKLGTE